MVRVRSISFWWPCFSLSLRWKFVSKSLCISVSLYLCTSICFYIRLYHIRLFLSWSSIHKFRMTLFLNSYLNLSVSMSLYISICFYVRLYHIRLPWLEFDPWMFGDQRLGYSGPFQPPFVARTVALKRSVILFFYRKRERKRNKKSYTQNQYQYERDTDRERQRKRERERVDLFLHPFVVRTVALKRSVVLFFIEKG